MVGFAIRSGSRHIIVMECRYLVLLLNKIFDRWPKDWGEGERDIRSKNCSLDGKEVKRCYYAAFCKQTIEKHNQCVSLLQIYGCVSWPWIEKRFVNQWRVCCGITDFSGNSYVHNIKKTLFKYWPAIINIRIRE